MSPRDAFARLNPVFASLKIGSNWLLLLFDSVVWILFIIDFNRIRDLNLDVGHLPLVARRAWESFGVFYALAAGAICFIPPLLNGLVSFLTRNLLTRRTVSSGLRDLLLSFHFITCLLFAVFVSFTTELQMLSGYKGDFSFSYRSTSSEFITWLVGGSAVSLFVIGLVVRFLSKSSWAEFKRWFKLLDTSSDYFPRQRANLIFANTASMAPPIQWIVKREEAYRYKYQGRVPSSDDAKQYLRDAAERSRELLREYLFQERTDAEDFSIEFLPLTSRGLEVGLTHIPNLRKIVISPYEHPSQKRVIEWFTTIHPHIEHDSIPMDYSILQRSWDQQRTWLIESLKAKLPANANEEKVAILISEVHYLTGFVLKVTEIIKSLRSEEKHPNLVFIVDGSQSVGNLLKPFKELDKNLRDEDFYYFSAHKWLLSPNTCGVLISRRKADRYTVRPYDLFGADLPTSTLDPGVIFGIKASLEYLIKEAKLREFHERSQSLKAYFIQELGDKFDVIESATHEMNHSSFVAVRPRAGHQWREASRKKFWEKIRSQGVELTVDELDDSDPSKWWLRISFPYFLQPHLLKQLIKHLQSRVISVN